VIPAPDSLQRIFIIRGNLPSQPNTIKGLTCIVDKKETTVLLRKWNKVDSFGMQNQKKRSGLRKNKSEYDDC
jgi:hypothetical protein